MKIAIRCHSRGGKTKKIAEAIASAVGGEVQPVTQPLTEDVDILFLGTAPYGFDVDDEVKTFINGIDVSVGKVILFSTSAVLKSIRKYVENPLADKKIPLAEEEFACRGEFLLLHRGRPNEADLEAAADFARKAVR